ncbi:unnamed protein product [Penicillium glandicola]
MLLPQVTTQLRGCSPALTESSPSTTTTNVEIMPGRPIEDHSDAIKYLGVDNFLDVVRRQYDSLTQLRTNQQIIKFRPVPEKEFDILSADGTRPCKFVKLQYHRPTEILLVKVVPGWDHENLISLIRKLIDKELIAMDVDLECLTLGSPRNELGDWVKEPDICWAPAFSSNKPTCVVEIGTSESVSHLSVDAHGWLEASQSPVQVVITISFKYLCAETDENPLSISVWKTGRRLSNIDTRNNLLPAIRTAHLDVWNLAGSLSVSGFSHDIDMQTPVSANEISLPLELFIGRPCSRPGEHDIVITRDKLLWVVHQLWEYRRQRGISHCLVAKNFKYTTPVLAAQESKLQDTTLLTSKAYHYLASPQEMKTRVLKILALREKAGILDRPLIIWEPAPLSCKPENLQACLETAALVDVFSPNHLELAALFGHSPVASDRSEIERLASTFLASGVGPEGQGAVVIRAGENGCFVQSRNIASQWVPPFYKTDMGGDQADKVVDPTGAENAFLGGYAVGYLQRGNIVEAACYGSVAASFAIEQVGMPEKSNEGDEELWNGASVVRRLHQYRARQMI